MKNPIYYAEKMRLNVTKQTAIPALISTIKGIARQTKKSMIAIIAKTLSPISG